MTFFTKKSALRSELFPNCLRKRLLCGIMEYSRRSYALLAIDRRGPIVKKAISALVSLLLGGAVALSFAGCTTQNTAGGTVSNSEAHRGLVSNSELAAGIVKNDPYTWFEAEKAVLPSRTDCEKIALGMTLNAVIRAIGKPQRDIGYGASVFQFDVADGSVFTVRFAPSARTPRFPPTIASSSRRRTSGLPFPSSISRSRWSSARSIRGWPSSTWRISPRSAMKRPPSASHRIATIGISPIRKPKRISKAPTACSLRRSTPSQRRRA